MTLDSTKGNQTANSIHPTHCPYVQTPSLAACRPRRGSSAAAVVHVETQLFPWIPLEATTHWIDLDFECWTSLSENRIMITSRTRVPRKAFEILSDRVICSKLSSLQKWRYSFPLFMADKLVLGCRTAGVALDHQTWSWLLEIHVLSSDYQFHCCLAHAQAGKGGIVW